MRPTLSLTLLSTLVGVSTLAAISACVGSTGPDRTLPFQIAYQWQTADLSAATLLIDQTGADKGVLAKTGDEYFHASFSPDGTLLLHDGIATNQIYVVDLRTGVETQLTQGSPGSQSPAWSPDGTTIGFLRAPNVPTNGFGLYVMRADGSYVRQLVSEGFAASGMAWSPDGRFLAVTSLYYGLVLVDATTGTVRRSLNPGATAYEADFSPDGKEIAYNVESGGAVNIYVSNVDGTNIRALTSSGFGSGYRVFPRWSPDGSMLAYYTYVRDSSSGPLLPAIGLMSRDGTPISLNGGATLHGSAPFWRRTP